MKYNFDEIIDRNGTNAVKVERCKVLFGTEEVLPLWVADMDFRTPDFITDAIRERLNHPLLGYTITPKEYFPSMIKWIYEHHGWEVKPTQIGFVPGVVPGLSYAVQCFTEKGDEVIVQPPVYYPFFNSIAKNGRVIVHNQLVEVDGKYEMDWEDLESKFTEKTKLFILCNPHNPGGRVWTRTELEKLAGICEKHNVLVVSDEIHADMILPGNTPHTPFATVSEWAENHSITYMAMTKVFNMPALISSLFIVPNRELFNQLNDYLGVSEQNQGNIFAFIGALAAVENGEEWRVQMLDYVQGNIEYVDSFLKANVPQVKAMVPEASFLVWLDCSDLGFADTDELHKFISLEAGLGLNKGTIFGPGGEQHVRLNVATPRANLEQAMAQLAEAVKRK
jgi:cystathionine beta-lyase